MVLMLFQSQKFHYNGLILQTNLDDDDDHHHHYRDGMIKKKKKEKKQPLDISLGIIFQEYNNFTS